jgi:integrase
VKKRHHGTGTLTERPTGSGKWQLRATYGRDPVTGKERRKSWTFEAKTRREAERQVGRILDAFEQGGVLGTRATVAQLLEEFMRVSASRGRSPNTLHDYRRIINQFLVPALGSIPIEDLTAHHLDSLYTSASKDRGLAASSIRRYHAVLSAALNQAVRWGWLERNPAERATLPSSAPKALQVPTPEEVRALIDACTARSETFGMFVLLAAVTGCRRGELAALRWDDVDQGSIAVRASLWSRGGESGIKSTKTGRERTVVIDGVVAGVLERWRARCLSVAADWGVTYVDDAFVFAARPDGSVPVNIDTYSSYFRREADALGLSHVHLHSLRHFAATELLSSGIDVKDVSTRLGHANANLTLAVYAHATDERQRAAAAVGSRVLGP